jgi:hypothetical protein
MKLQPFPRIFESINHAKDQNFVCGNKLETYNEAKRKLKQGKHRFLFVLLTKILSETGVNVYFNTDAFLSDAYGYHVRVWGGGLSWGVPLQAGLVLLPACPPRQEIPVQFL